MTGIQGVRAVDSNIFYNVQVQNDVERMSSNAEPDIEKSSENAGSMSKPAVEVCIASTDQVDGEIERLKAKEAQLSQRMSGADEIRRIEMEKQLAQVQNELRQKDNDAYRRKHTEFSSGIDLQV